MKPATAMSHAISCCLFTVIPLLFTVTQGPAAPAIRSDISGAWELTLVGPDETNVERIQLKADGDKISGKHGQNGNLEGTITAAKLELKELGDDKKVTAEFTGSVALRLRSSLLPGDGG